MPATEQADPDPLRDAIAAAIIAHKKLFMVEGLGLMVLGGLAFAFPMISTLAIEIFVGWLFVIGGVLRLASRIRARHTPGYWWSMAAAVLAVGVGAVLIAMPLQGMLTLTLFLMAIFLVEGISAILASLDFRHHSANWGWLAFSGIVNLVLVGIIGLGLPGIATWAIGMLVGVNLLFSGLSLVMLSIAARKQKAGIGAPN